MEFQGKLCPNCGFDLERVRDVLEQEALAFCLQCQFPLQLVAGKYRLEREIWRGSNSIVYLARHIHLDRDAERVVKVIRPEIFKIAGMERRFRREVQITSALSQRNDHIVRIYDDFGEVPKLGHFYVMEHLQGETLSQLLDQLQEPPPLPFTFYLFLQLCETMQFAHEQGVVHRDLKPHNLMLVQRKGDPFFLKVYDFGIAKPLSSDELAVTHVTQGSLGTPAYMSPEQCLNKPTDVRTDIYAMGIMLYEMLVGHTPFLPPVGDNSAFSSAVGIIEGHLTKAPPPPGELRPDRASKALEHVVLRALAKKPEERYQSVDELQEALEQVVSTWPSAEQVLLHRLHNDKIKPPISLARKPVELPSEDWSLADNNEHHTWFLGVSSRVFVPGDDASSPDSQGASPTQDIDALGSSGASPSVLVSSELQASDDEVVLAEVSLLDDVSQSQDTQAQASFSPESLPSDAPSAPHALSLSRDADEARPTMEMASLGSAPLLTPSEEDSALAFPDTLLVATDTPNDDTEISRPELLAAEPPSPQSEPPLSATAALEFSVTEVATPFPQTLAPEASNAPEKATPQSTPGSAATEPGSASKADPTTPQAAPSLVVERVHGPHNGMIRMFLSQRQDWESDPFLVKNLQERVLALQRFIQGPDFSRLYPHCQGKIVLEAHSFPPEIARRFVQEGVELRLLPRADDAAASTNASAPSAATPTTPVPVTATPATPPPPAPVTTPPPPALVQTPALVASSSSVPVAAAASTTPRPVPAAESEASRAPGAKASTGASGASVSAHTVPQPRPAMLSTSYPPVNNGNVPTALDAPAPGQGPTPVALWDDRDEAPLASRSRMVLVPVVALFVLAVIGILYGLSSDTVSGMTGPPKGLMVSSVSATTLPPASYKTISLTPDRRTFVLIPVVDNESGNKELFVLFAAKENRRLLVFANSTQSQVLQRVIEKQDRDEIVPVFTKDLQGSAPNPRARTFTGSLERLQRYEGGPLELILPDGHRNINKILGYRQQGIQFPMDSMILMVGQRPQPPSNSFRSVVLMLSFLLALVSGGLFLGLRNRLQQPF